MTHSQVLSRLNAIMRDVFDDPTLIATEKTTAEDVPGWDSNAHINLVVAVETDFGIRFRTAELEGLRNVGDFAKLIESRRGQ